MKKSTIIRIILYSLLTLILLFAYRHRISGLVSKLVYDDSVAELTMEQKLSDFNDLYDTLSESIPYFDDIDSLYGIDFRDRHDYYESKIRETTDNCEFYCTLQAISQDIPSFHTDICFPLYSNIRNIQCCGSDEVLDRFNMKGKIDSWYEIIGDTVRDYENVNILWFEYLNGEYYVDERFLPESYEELSGYRLVTIDGTDADEYIIQNISAFGMHYDHINDKAYRKAYVLNDSTGSEVSVVLESEDGSGCEISLYVDAVADVVANYGFLYDPDRSVSDVNNSIYIFRDDEHQLEYIEISNFTNNEGKQLARYIEDSPYNTFVIDLRNNYGGTIDYAVKYLYPGLYMDDAGQSYSWIVPDTDSNHAMTKDWVVLLNYGNNSSDGFYYYNETNTFKGESDKQNDIYYLVGTGTGSAADTYISMIKDNHLGTIIGDTTGGEGLGFTYICSYLKESSLIYVYYPSVSYDPATGEHILGGTTPDIYVTPTLEEIHLQNEYIRSGTDDEYEMRLQYDPALKWVIENG